MNVGGPHTISYRISDIALKIFIAASTTTGRASNNCSTSILLFTLRWGIDFDLDPAFKLTSSQNF